MSKIVVLNGPDGTLPFKEVLSWESFQTFCTDVLASDPQFSDARDFLKQGNKQEGIDVYAIPKGDGEMTVAQCKGKNYIAPSEVKEIIRVFLEGNLSGKVQKFILCTNFDFSTKAAEEAIANARNTLTAEGIDFVVWDKAGLEKELRIHPKPQIVTHYFGEEIASAFYGSLYQNWIKQYRKVTKRTYEAQADHIERTLTPIGELNKERSYFFESDEPLETLHSIFTPVFKETGKRVVMLSLAGFGKTWEMKQLAANFTDEGKVLFPILNYLRDYEGQSIDALLQLHEIDWGYIPKEILLLIFDGLDEIKGEHFQTFINHLNQFAEAHPKVNIIVSSRFNFYNLEFSSLREFEVYLLNEFTTKDVNAYLSKNLGHDEATFNQKINSTGFSDYLKHPYYLSRLVRFFKDKSIPFPSNKPELFERVLFERFEKDRNNYGVKLPRTSFICYAEKVAFCLTMLGKSSLSEEELEAIISDENTRTAFKKFFLLMPDMTTTGELSFEHKNLQEFLCASFLQRFPFDTAKQLLTLPHAPNTLQPKLLNTVSFLFGIAEESFFQELLAWIKSSQPRVLVRFEKDRISKEVRVEIFKQIIDYQNSKNLSLYHSSNFSIKDLASFVELDIYLLNYLEELIFNPETNDWLAHDIIYLLSIHEKAYTIKSKLTEIILRVLSTRNHFSDFAAGCINALVEIDSFSENTVNLILDSGIDFNQFDIRAAFVSYLDKGGLAEKHVDFVLESIPIYQKGQEQTVRYGTNERLEQIIISFKKPESIKKVLQWMIRRPELVNERSIDHAIHFSQEAVAKILESAQNAYAGDRSILRCVYRIFVKDRHLVHDDKYAESFKKFFAATCGEFAMFKKFYQRKEYEHDAILFITIEGCDFLLNEYGAGKITDEKMTLFRNWCWVNRSLFGYFQDKLLQKYGDKFAIDETVIDYDKIWRENEIKNQQMLLDREFFFEEAEQYAQAIGKENFTSKDLWDHENSKLVPFQRSLVATTVRGCVRKTHKTMDEAVGELHKDENWEWFKIQEIKDLLAHRKEEETIDPLLIRFAEEWCLKKMQSLDYENAVQQTVNDSWSVNGEVHFNNELYALLRMDVDDELLLKVLMSDTTGGMNKGNLGLAGVIANKVQDKELLKQVILGNLKKELPIMVLRAHLALCHQLRYLECLPTLFEVIISHPFMSTHEKTVLTDYYLELGGSISDFQSYLADNVPKENHYISWAWYLLEKLKDEQPALVSKCLLDALEDPDQLEMNKIQACSLLISMNEIEGLFYWREYVITNRRLPFDHRQDIIIQHGPQMPVDKTVPILIEVLEFTYNNNLHEKLRFPDSIEDAVYAILYAVAIVNQHSFETVLTALDVTETKFSELPIIRQISFAKERIAQEFYKQQNVEYNLNDVLLLYNDVNSKAN